MPAGRSTIIVRTAESSDIDTVCDMAMEARAESSLGVQLGPGDPAVIKRYLAHMAAIPGMRLAVAETAGEMAGFMLSRTVTSDLVDLEPAVYLEALYVRKDARRAGVGRALMATAAEFAVQAGAQEILSLPLPGARGTQRFLARLGFGPAATHRVVQVSVLQRNLATEPTRAPHITRTGAVARSLDEIIARRRKHRDGTITGSVDMRSFRDGTAITSATPRVNRAG